MVYDDTGRCLYCLRRVANAGSSLKPDNVIQLVLLILYIIGAALTLVVLALFLVALRKPGAREFLLSRRQPEKQDDNASRSQLAQAVTTWALAFIGILGIVIVGAAAVVAYEAPGDKSTFFFDTAKYVLGVLLPVVGAWVGTVLAFYFGRENYKAAAESAASLVEQLSPQEKLSKTSAKDVMIPIADAVVYQLDAAEKPSDINIAKLFKDGFNKGGKKWERLPILDHAKRGLNVLHRSTVNDYLVRQSKATPPIGEDTLTLANLIADTPALTNSFKTVAPAASAADAKLLIDQTPDCLDVLVTVDGTKGTEVLGWITNVKLLETATM